MKSFLLVFISILLIAIWAILFYVLNFSAIVHILLVIVAFILLVVLFFSKRSTNNTDF
jgi:hypothetical protein